MSNTHQRVSNRYPDRSKDFLNFTVTPWFNNRYAQVVASKNQKRIKRYKAIDPLKLVIEYPRAIFRSKGYFHSTISARMSGLCFPDPKIMFVPYARFLNHIDPKNNIHENPSVPVNITIDTLIDYAKEQTSLPEKPQIYLTTLSDEPNTYAVLLLSTSRITTEDIAEVLTGGYNFQHLLLSLYQEEDPEYPKTQSDTLEGLLGGTGVIEELLLKEQVIRFKFFNIKTIQDIYNDAQRNHYHDGVYRYDGSITYSG